MTDGRRGKPDGDGWRAEDWLLLCCARTRMSAETAARARGLLDGELDWDYLLFAAHRHGVMPLLAWHVNAMGSERVPDKVRRQLREDFENNQRRNLVLSAHLCRLLKLFETQGIPAIAYKGPALAVAVYGSLGLRQFGDLDLIVAREDVPRTREILVSEGYCPEVGLTQAQESRLLRSQHAYAFVRDGGKLVVELHWETSPRQLSAPPDPERLWTRLERVSLAGNEVLSLSRGVLLLSLCEHGAKHCWERLAWICDVAELIRADAGLDWDRILAQARRTGSERMLLLGLYLAHDLLDAEVPVPCRPRMRADRVVPALAARVRAQLLRTSRGLHPRTMESGVFHLQARERWRDRIRYCRFALVPTVADWERLPLPAALSWLYYPLRVVRLVTGAGRSARNGGDEGARA